MIIDTVLREEYGQLAKDFNPHTILDGGAYIGDVTAYFATRFPGARIVAVEAAQATFLMAEKNLKPYGDRVTLENAALWSKETMVRFGGSETGASVGSDGDFISATTVGAVLERQGWSELDLLKLDIEGAELEVLRSGVGLWLDRVKCIILEIHGSEMTAQVVPLLVENGFVCLQYRSVWYCDRDHVPQSGVT
jgi:FkbM family methyltransferase